MIRLDLRKLRVAVVVLATTAACDPAGDAVGTAESGGVPRVASAHFSTCGIQTEPKGSVAGWLESAEVVVEGRVRVLDLAWTPFTFSSSTRPEIATAEVECPGVIEPGLAIELDDVEVLQGEVGDPGVLRVQIGSALASTWNPVPVADERELRWLHIDGDGDDPSGEIVVGQRLFLALRRSGDDFALWGDIMATPDAAGHARYLSEYCVTDQVRALTYRQVVDQTRAAVRRGTPALPDLSPEEWAMYRGGICFLADTPGPERCLTDGSCPPEGGRRMRCVDGRCEPTGDAVEIIE